MNHPMHTSSCGVYRDGGLSAIRNNRCTCGADSNDRAVGVIKLTPGQAVLASEAAWSIAHLSELKTRAFKSKIRVEFEAIPSKDDPCALHPYLMDFDLTQEMVNSSIDAKIDKIRQDLADFGLEIVE